MSPWPSAFTHYNGKLMKIFKMRYVDDSREHSVGEIVRASSKEGLIVQIGDGLVEILECQLEGSRRMDTRSYLLGHEMEIGSILGN